MMFDFIKAFRDAHARSDTDNEPSSIHHTLGKGPNNAAPGNHNHDADYSASGHNHDAAYSAVGHSHAAPFAYYEVISGTQNIATDTWTKILNWTSVDLDGVTFSSNTWTIVTAGRYKVRFKTAFPSNATGNRYLRIMKNGGQIGYNISPANGGGASTFVEASVEENFAVGDVIQADCHQTSGGSLAIMTVAGYTQATIRYVGA